MINAIVSNVFKILFFILRWVFNILLLPLKPILLLFPQFDDFTQTAIAFIDDYLFRPIAFGKEVFINMTGFPQALITISTLYAFALLSVIGILRVVTFVKNIWKTIKGGDS